MTKEGGGNRGTGIGDTSIYERRVSERGGSVCHLNVKKGEELVIGKKSCATQKGGMQKKLQEERGSSLLGVNTKSRKSSTIGRK